MSFTKKLSGLVQHTVETFNCMLHWPAEFLCDMLRCLQLESCFSVDFRWRYDRILPKSAQNSLDAEIEAVFNAPNVPAKIVSPRGWWHRATQNRRKRGRGQLLSLPVTKEYESEYSHLF